MLYKQKLVFTSAEKVCTKKGIFPLVFLIEFGVFLAVQLLACNRE